MKQQQTFNLLYEPWITAVDQSDKIADYCLLDVFSKAAQLREVKGEFPIVTIALYRLLLAILHRCLGPADLDAWKGYWTARKFDLSRVNTYLNNC